MDWRPIPADRDCGKRVLHVGKTKKANRPGATRNPATSVIACDCATRRFAGRYARSIPGITVPYAPHLDPRIRPPTCPEAPADHVADGLPSLPAHARCSTE